MATVTIPAGDLALEGGTLVFCDGKSFYRQKLASRFRFFQGSWFIDKRQGIPYFRDVFVKSPDLNLIGSLFRRVILTTPGVKSLGKFALTFDSGQRRLFLSFEAALVGGETLVVKPTDRDFIISV